MTLRLPENADADEDEAAAIAAAVDAYLRAAAVAASVEAGRPAEPWAGVRWAFAGRLAGLGLPVGRVPASAPRSRWAAAGRADRY